MPDAWHGGGPAASSGLRAHPQGQGHPTIGPTTPPGAGVRMKHSSPDQWAAWLRRRFPSATVQTSWAAPPGSPPRQAAVAGMAGTGKAIQPAITRAAMGAAWSAEGAHRMDRRTYHGHARSLPGRPPTGQASAAAWVPPRPVELLARLADVSAVGMPPERGLVHGCRRRDRSHGTPSGAARRCGGPVMENCERGKIRRGGHPSVKSDASQGHEVSSNCCPIRPRGWSIRPSRPPGKQPLRRRSQGSRPAPRR